MAIICYSLLCYSLLNDPPRKQSQLRRQAAAQLESIGHAALLTAKLAPEQLLESQTPETAEGQANQSPSC